VAVGHDSATLALGNNLTIANGCQDCHTATLGGKVMIDDPAFVRVIASNLTAGEGGVLARYDDRALDAEIRDGVGWVYPHCHQRRRPRCDGSDAAKV